MAGNTDLERTGHVIDAFHDLELFVLHLVRILVPVGLGLDEKGRAAGIAIGCLHHEISTEPGFFGNLHEVVETFCAAEHVGCTIDTGFVGQSRQLDLRI